MAACYRLHRESSLPLHKRLTDYALLCRLLLFKYNRISVFFVPTYASHTRITNNTIKGMVINHGLQCGAATINPLVDL